MNQTEIQTTTGRFPCMALPSHILSLLTQGGFVRYSNSCVVFGSEHL